MWEKMLWVLMDYYMSLESNVFFSHRLAFLTLEINKFFTHVCNSLCVSSLKSKLKYVVNKMLLLWVTESCYLVIWWHVYCWFCYCSCKIKSKICMNNELVYMRADFIIRWCARTINSNKNSSLNAQRCGQFLMNYMGV